MMRYHRARYYHPQLRRFLNQDVLLGSIVGPSSLNRFAYANDNPVSLVDPLGLWQITVGGGAGLGIQFTIGNNGGSGSTNGQWNFGVHFGVGEGAYVNVDPSNSGYHEQGNVGSVEGTGGIGLGPNVETSAHIEGQKNRVRKTGSGFVVCGQPGAPPDLSRRAMTISATQG